ncbi:hypothetical protein AB751O23_AJ_00140 [Chlamydiales bacterium SCGC AB-751-O23]|nr:hypothetical protein AB751O23_AJ_00140 [Chlamydiales bacterium SCGC AB-751-O23]
MQQTWDTFLLKKVSFFILDFIFWSLANMWHAIEVPIELFLRKRKKWSIKRKSSI